MRIGLLSVVLVCLLGCEVQAPTAQSVFDGIELAGAKIVAAVDAAIPGLVHSKGKVVAARVVAQVADTLVQIQREKQALAAYYNEYGGSRQGAIGTIAQAAVGIIEVLDANGVELDPEVRRVVAYAPVALVMLPSSAPENKVQLPQQRDYQALQANWLARVNGR